MNGQLSLLLGEGGIGFMTEAVPAGRPAGVPRQSLGGGVQVVALDASGFWRTQETLVTQQF